MNPEISNVENRNLEMGDNKWRTETLVDGESVVKGEVLGIITATEKVAASAIADVDGREFAKMIAAEDKIASGQDEKIRVVFAGDVDDSLLVFDGSEGLASFPVGSDETYREMLRGVGIYANTYPNVLIQDNQ